MSDTVAIKVTKLSWPEEIRTFIQRKINEAESEANLHKVIKITR